MLNAQYLIFNLRMLIMFQELIVKSVILLVQTVVDLIIINVLSVLMDFIYHL